MAEYIVHEHQDLIDISIQNFGELESGLFRILEDNSTLSLNSNLVSGQKLEVANEALGDADVKEFFSNLQFVVVNVDEVGLFTDLGDYNEDFNNDYS